MTLQELRYIVAVANARHFGKAAKACFVTQQTLSIAIKKFEDALGVPVFERDQQEVRLTETGHAIVNQAKRILDEMATLKNIAHAGKDQLKGVLKLGAIYTVAPYRFSLLIPKLRKAAPHMPLEIHENYTDEFRATLRSGEVDVVMLALPFEEPGIVTQKLYKESFVVLMPHNHPLAAYDEITENQLMSESLLLLGKGHCFRTNFMAACPSCFVPGKETVNVIEGSSLETIRLMVASGLGITILPITAAKSSIHMKHVLTTRPLVGNKTPTRTIALAWRASFPRPKVIDLLREIICATPHEGIEYLV